MITGLLYMLAALLVVLWMTSLVFAEIEWRIRKRRIQRRWDEARPSVEE